MKNTKIVELVIDEDSQELAIDAISLVSAPAIEENWVFFGKEKNNLTLAKVDEDKRMLVSPALIPDKQIFRYDPNTDSEYYVYFSKETVRKASELYLKNNNHHKATQEHTERVSGVLTVESWIIEDSKTDKSTLYGFSLPKGTWMVMMKIENDELWSKIKSGELKGLSIEGYFTNKFEQMQKKEPTTEQILSAFNEIIRENVSPKKTEFSLVSDAKKFLNDYKKSVPKIKSLGDKADNLKSTLLKIDKEVTDAKKIVETEQQTLETEWKELKSLADQMEKIYSNFYDEFKNADRLVDDFIVRSKELGIDPNDSKDYVKLRNAVAESRKITEDASFNIIQWTKKLKNLDY